MQAEHSQAVYTASSNYILRDIAGESILVSIGPGVADFCGVVVLNESAKILWTTLLGGATPGELAAALVQAFQISPVQAQADVEETLSILMERGMVQYA